jgi:hypothetical protein
VALNGLDLACGAGSGVGMEIEVMDRNKTEFEVAKGR